jgi:hypothetical protein
MATLSLYNYPTLADLQRAVYTGTAKKLCIAHGHSALGDGGGSRWVWNPASTREEDGIFTLRRTGYSGTGRFERLVEDGTLNAASLGLRPHGGWHDPITGFDCAPLLNRLIQLAPRYGVERIYVPPPPAMDRQQPWTYLCKSPIVLDKRVVFEGAPSHVWTPKTTFTFHDSDGFRLLGGTEYDENNVSKGWRFNEVVLRNVGIFASSSDYEPGSPYPLESDRVGVFTNCHFLLEGLYVAGFGGTGYLFHGNSADRPLSTNANCSRLERCMAQYNTVGFHIRGGDINVSVFDQLNSINNKYWGIVDESLLGVDIRAAHMANNSIFGSSEKNYPNGRTWVEVDGVQHFFQARRDSRGQRPQVVNGVGVSDYWYTYHGTANIYGLHTEWKEDVLIRGCGAYTSLRATCASTVVGGYTEENQGHSVITGQTTVLGGFHGTPVYGRLEEVGMSGSETGMKVMGSLLTREVQLLHGGSISSSSEYRAFQITGGAGNSIYVNSQGGGVYVGPTNPFSVQIAPDGTVTTLNNTTT